MPHTEIQGKPLFIIFDVINHDSVTEWLRREDLCVKKWSYILGYMLNDAGVMSDSGLTHRMGMSVEARKIFTLWVSHFEGSGRGYFISFWIISGLLITLQQDLQRKAVHRTVTSGGRIALLSAQPLSNLRLYPFLQMAWTRPNAEENLFKIALELILHQPFTRHSSLHLSHDLMQITSAINLSRNLFANSHATV